MTRRLTAVRILFPLSLGKGGEGDRTAWLLIAVSPSPSGKGIKGLGSALYFAHSLLMTKGFSAPMSSSGPPELIRRVDIWSADNRYGFGMRLGNEPEIP